MRFVTLVGGVFVLSFVLTALVRQYALRRAMVDEPGARSSHLVATPRGGGAAFVVSYFFALVVLSRWFELPVSTVIAVGGAGAAVALVGFWDDHGGLSARVRLVVHGAAALWAVVWLGGVLGGLPALPIGAWIVPLGSVGTLVAVLGLVWLLNLFNFMDGIDGLAASQAAFVALAGAALLAWAGEVPLAAASLALAVATLGFLLWNLPPARIFMGDVGSGFLGILLGALGLAAAHAVPGALWAWVILPGLFVVDATVTLVVRLLRGTHWSEAHRRHAYQRLARRWGSHGRVTLLYTGINVLWLLPWATGAWMYPAWGLVAVVCAFAPLVWWVWHVGAGESEDEGAAAPVRR